MNNVMYDFSINPQKYLSYEKFVKYAIQDYRPASSVLGLYQFTAVSYPSPKFGQAIIFKIDGAKVHKKLNCAYLMVSPIQLEAYGKTKEEFYEDWKACHKK